MKLVYLACLIMENLLKRLGFQVNSSLNPHKSINKLITPVDTSASTSDLGIILDALLNENLVQ